MLGWKWTLSARSEQSFTATFVIPHMYLACLYCSCRGTCYFDHLYTCNDRASLAESFLSILGAMSVVRRRHRTKTPDPNMSPPEGKNLKKAESLLKSKARGGAMPLKRALSFDSKVAVAQFQRGLAIYRRLLG